VIVVSRQSNGQLDTGQEVCDCDSMRDEGGCSCIVCMEDLVVMSA
jgi:hypothetical protein